MSFQTANAELAGLLRAAHDAGTPDKSVVRTIASATGAVTEVLYAKTADGAAGYSYVLLDGSFAEAAPATGDIITTVLAHGQLEDLKHRMNTAAAAAITPPGWTTPEIEAYCSEWLKANTTNFTHPDQLHMGVRLMMTCFFSINRCILREHVAAELCGSAFGPLARHRVRLLMGPKRALSAHLY